jgi:hypothetical protein
MKQSLFSICEVVWKIDEVRQGDGEGTTLNLPLPGGAGDYAMRYAFLKSHCSVGCPICFSQCLRQQILYHRITDGASWGPNGVLAPLARQFSGMQLSITSLILLCLLATAWWWMNGSFKVCQSSHIVHAYLTWFLIVHGSLNITKKNKGISIDF